MKSKYVLQQTEKSFCPICSEPVSLLASDDLKRQHSFYICFLCKEVFEVGVGKVKKVGHESTYKPRQEEIQSSIIKGQALVAQNAVNKILKVLEEK